MAGGGCRGPGREHFADPPFFVPGLLVQDFDRAGRPEIRGLRSATGRTTAVDLRTDGGFTEFAGAGSGVSGFSGRSGLVLGRHDDEFHLLAGPVHRALFC